MGIGHGAYCVGCCWALMALLFVGGAMNVVWIAALTGFVLAEKLLPAGVAFDRVAAAVLAVWAAATVFA
jgi:predicted metal-binding membrane protein